MMWEVRDTVLFIHVLRVLFCSIYYSDRGMRSDSVLCARTGRWCCYTWSSFRPLLAHSLCATAVVVVVTSLGDAASQGQFLLCYFKVIRKLSLNGMTTFRSVPDDRQSVSCGALTRGRSVRCSDCWRSTEIAPYRRVLLTATAGDQPCLDCYWKDWSARHLF
jgi:hypothetical protein